MTSRGSRRRIVPDQTNPPAPVSGEQSHDGLRVWLARRDERSPWLLPDALVSASVELMREDGWEVVEMMPVTEHHATVARALKHRVDEIEPYEKANTDQKH